jgi:hypothetical protein
MSVNKFESKKSVDMNNELRITYQGPCGNYQAKLNHELDGNRFSPILLYAKTIMS